jgi:hypothetical protein
MTTADHTANMTKARNSTGKFSPDLAPADCHLFRSLSNNLRGVSFNNDAELQNWLDQSFTAKPADFFKHGIGNLPERWEVVMNNGGEYIID